MTNAKTRRFQQALGHCLGSGSRRKARSVQLQLHPRLQNQCNRISRMESNAGSIGVPRVSLNVPVFGKRRLFAASSLTAMKYMGLGPILRRLKKRHARQVRKRRTLRDIAEPPLGFACCSISQFGLLGVFMLSFCVNNTYLCTPLYVCNSGASLFASIAVQDKRETKRRS